jgi:hypothetical protein
MSFCGDVYVNRNLINKRQDRKDDMLQGMFQVVFHTMELFIATNLSVSIILGIRRYHIVHGSCISDLSRDRFRGLTFPIRRRG